MIYLTADWHGSMDGFNDFTSSLNRELTEDDTVIILGDAGIIYGTHVAGSLRKAMKKLPCTFFIIRGNHDKRYGKYAKENPDRWEVIEYAGNEAYVDKKYPNIIYARDDAAIYTIENIKFLLIPGAYSVDKQYRIARGWPWEEDEQLTKHELLDAIDLNFIEHPDIILSHTGPLQFQEQMKDLLLSYVVNPDNTMENALDIIYLDFSEERQDNPQWFFGHFHGERDFNDNVHLIYHKAVQVKSKE